jgi:hypothetical protein
MHLPDGLVQSAAYCEWQAAENTTNATLNTSTTASVFTELWKLARINEMAPQQAVRDGFLLLLF